MNAELEILEFSRPEDIEGLKQRARQETDIVANLEIVDNGEITSNSGEIEGPSRLQRRDGVRHGRDGPSVSYRVHHIPVRTSAGGIQHVCPQPPCFAPNLFISFCHRLAPIPLPRHRHL